MNTVNELLSLKKPTRIDRVLACVPRPPNSLPPRTGLPMWQVVPLYWKLPVMSDAPKETMVFYREKLGEKLMKAFCCPEYYLKDPDNHEVLFPYESLHDPHLKKYYKRKFNRDRMEKRGFVTKDGDVLCSLAEYNMYRRYLNRLHLYNLHNAIWWNDALQSERFELRQFEQFLERDIERDERDECFREACASMREERLAAEEDRRERLEEARLVKAKRAQDALERRLEIRALDREAAMWAARRIVQHLANAQCIKRHVAVRVLRKMCDGDRELRLRLRQRKRQLREERDIKRHGRWQCKLHCQLRRFAREQQLLRWDAEIMQDLMELRSESLDRHQRHMDNLLERIQAKQAKQIAAKKSKKSKLAFLHAVTKVWGIPEGMTAWGVEQAVLSALAQNSSEGGGHNVLAALHEVKQNLEKSAQLPEEVTYALDSLLENVIKEFIRVNVTKVVENVQTLILERVTETVAARSRRRSDTSRRSSVSSLSRAIESGRRRSSGLQFPSFVHETVETSSNASGQRRRSGLSRHKTFSTQSLSRTISFGEVQTIGKFVTSKEMVSVKDRPPTPVPSLEELATAVLEDPEEIQSTVPNVSVPEKEKLMSLFQALSNTLFKNVTKHFEKKGKTVKRVMHGLLSTQIRLNDVVRRLTDKIAASSEEVLKDTDELHMTEEYLIQELEAKINTEEEKAKSKFQPTKRTSI